MLRMIAPAVVTLDRTPPELLGTPQLTLVPPPADGSTSTAGDVVWAGVDGGERDIRLRS